METDIMSFLQPEGTVHVSDQYHARNFLFKHI